MNGGSRTANSNVYSVATLRARLPRGAHYLKGPFIRWIVYVYIYRVSNREVERTKAWKQLVNSRLDMNGTSVSTFSESIVPPYDSHFIRVLLFRHISHLERINTAILWTITYNCTVQPTLTAKLIFSVIEIITSFIAFNALTMFSYFVLSETITNSITFIS